MVVSNRRTFPLLALVLFSLHGFNCQSDHTVSSLVIISSLSLLAHWRQGLLPGAGILHVECILHIAYWVQHFPQHHLSGSGIAQLEFYHCREPVWGTPPMTKVMRKEAQHTQRRDRTSGVPLEILEHLPPKPESAYFLLCALTYTSDFTGGCPPLPRSEKRVSLQLQLIIPGCDSVSTYKLLWKSSSLPE